MSGLTIGRLAAEAGVSVETVRFYERRGLIRRPPRPASGYRRYGEDVVRRLGFIRRAKDLGFSLREIAELLELRSGDGTACEDVEAAAERTIERIERQVAELTRMKSALAALAESCRRGEATGECPILDALED
ncbi:MAG: MerR family DNA-binding protein [Gemmatimonadota bacterium]